MGQVVVKTGKCLFCGREGEVDISHLQGAELRYLNFYAARVRGESAFIQDYFPDLTAGEREQIISGTHEECFDQAFADEEDEIKESEADEWHR